MKSKAHLFGRHLLLWSAVALPLFVTGPLSLFSANFADFDLGALQFGGHLAPLLLIVPLIASITASLPYQKALQCALLWVSLALYAQGNLLVWDYGLLDGSEVPWGDYRVRGVVDCAVWSTLLVFVFFARNRVERFITLIALFLSLLHITTATVSFARSDAPLTVQTKETAGEHLFAFSRDKNVLVIVLDEFSSRGFYTLLEKNPSLKTEFAGFTFYRDLLGYFPTTYPALPMILTGQVPNVTGSMFEYLENATPTSINEQLAEQGWNAQAVSIHPMCKNFKKSSCQSLEQALALDSGAAGRRDLLKLIDVSLFRHAPQFLKRLILNDDQWFLQSIGRTTSSKAPQPGEVQLLAAPHHESAVELLQSFADKMSNEASAPSFKLLHVLIPHSPHTLSPSCEGYRGPKPSTPVKYLNTSLCALTLVHRVLDQMRKLEVYDNTTIVILGDHGTSVGFDFAEFGEPMLKEVRRAFPLALIKPAGKGANVGNELIIDNTSLAQDDLIRLVSEAGALGLSMPKNAGTGRRQERSFYLYTWSDANWSSGSLPPAQEYKISGDSWIASNWSKK